MSIMVAEVYEAFISVGIKAEKAKAAAEALSSEQLATRVDIIKIERELAVLKWMVGGIDGIILTLCITILAKLFIG